MNKIPSDEEIRYELATKRVKELKGFYTHVLAYVLVNLIIVVININDLKPGENYFQPKNFITAFFWGIGLVAHGFSVFGANIFFGKDWEEKKIKELMNKDKKRNQNWE
ncbi:MAG: 2TM domain-containing protein [Flavobacteriaceae bacterium]